VRVGLTQTQYRQILLGPSILAQKVVAQVAPLPKKAVPGRLQPVAHVRPILITLHPTGKPARTDAQAHALAQKLLAQLQHGASFAALVKKYSDDPGSIATGGAYTVHPKEMVPPFDHASFTLPPHKPTIIHSQFGYHIIEVLSRGTAPGASTSPQQVQQTNFVKWLNAQVKAAKIKRIAQVKG
jgi:parvulin-like peptidyl-prolyl isomerase